MKFLNLLPAALLPALSLAAPTHASLALDAVNAPDAVNHLSDYFNLLSRKVQRFKALNNPPACVVSRAVLPIAKPAPATLYDVSCRLLPLLDAPLSSISYEPVPKPLAVFDQSAARQAARPTIGPQPVDVSGVHYFNDLGQPFFNIDLAGAGHVTVKLNNSIPAPYDAAVGLAGEKAVGWLKLIVREEEGSATKGLKEVYRVNTVGGSPASTCEGMPETFEVEYVAQYWFMGSDEGDE
ncbi:hypothetical protein jhhlp_001822 [Lomentospora prolificans]|uniref:Malate dehydrogenase n=1 Tax=Lomentospora prolificans TaxID=41688 RepID=A0A2N3NH03_9PEZI|nr:hypothetical protein jhhlp_001822 [Lomentospora prolificans]